MGHLLTIYGEEFWTKNGLDGQTLEVGLYNDTTDSIGDTDDLAAISTEPGNANYARQSDTFTAANFSGDWGADNDTELSFDLSDNTSTDEFDSYFIVANFQSAEAGDSGANDHLISTGALSKGRELDSVDTFKLNAGGAGLTLD